jgi:23S rRNA G2069 N7-methylase RlmK/C1962 C5-methylase RlmI
MKTFLKLLLGVAFLASLTSCSSSRKITTKQELSIDTSSRAEVVKIEQKDKLDTATVKTEELAFVEKEEDEVKQTVVEKFTPEGKLDTRTTIKEKVKTKEREQTQKITTETKGTHEQSQASHEEVKEKKGQTTSEAVTSKRSKLKAFTGIATLVLIFLLLIPVYKYLKNRYPSKYWPL